MTTETHTTTQGPPSLMVGGRWDSPLVDPAHGGMFAAEAEVRALANMVAARHGFAVRCVHDDGGRWAFDLSNDILVWSSFDPVTRRVITRREAARLVVHEIGHRLVTGGYTAPATVDRLRFHGLVNAAEDVRMEDLMCGVFPGFAVHRVPVARDVLTWRLRSVWHRNTPDTLERVWVSLMWVGDGCGPLSSVPRSKYLTPDVRDLIAECLPDWTTATTARRTREMVPALLRILARIDSFDGVQAEQSDDGDDQPGNPDQPGDDGDDADGDDQPGPTNPGPTNPGPTNPGPDGDGDDDGDDGDDRNGGGGAPDGDDDADTDPMDGGRDVRPGDDRVNAAVNASRAVRMIDQRDASHTAGIDRVDGIDADVLDRVTRWMGNAATSTAAPDNPWANVPPNPYYVGHPSAPPDMTGTVRGVTRNLSNMTGRRLSDILDTNGRGGVQRRTTRGRLDRRRAGRVLRGDVRVMRRNTAPDGVTDWSAIVCLDASSSMSSGDRRDALAALLVLADAADRIDGLDVGACIWSGLVDYAVPPGRMDLPTVAAKYYAASGGTNERPALEWAYGASVAHGATGRIVVVATDGETCDPQGAADTAASMAALGFVTVGIGIGYGAPAHHPHRVNIRDPRHLPHALTGVIGHIMKGGDPGDHTARFVPSR